MTLADFPDPTDAIAGWRIVAPGLVSAGQPECRHWRTLAAMGVRSVVNLRPATEQAGRDEAAEVAAAGMHYAWLPIADGGDLGRAAAAALDRELRRMPEPILVHCASGNRVGALIALREAWHSQAPVEQAIQRGQAAGLAGLEPRVRQLLSVGN